MTTNNKILTVSYGTFSCTLEGFEDNFGTMKAIAEYFRDLAADDRYFGAEPAQPDAEMLTRIAEREISRRVQAREQEGRIVLSASEPAAHEAPVVAPEAVAAAAPAIAAAAVASAPDLVDSAPASADDTASDDMITDVAEPLATETVADERDAADIDDASDVLDMAASQTDVTLEAEHAVVTPENIAETDDADQMPEAATEVEADVIAPAHSAEVIAEGPEEDTAEDTAEDIGEDTDAAAFFAETDDAAEVEAAEDVVAEAVEPAAPATAPADSIAAKLQRIRAVVSQSQQDAAEDELFEDEHADDAVAADAEEEASEVATAARDIEEAFDIDDANTDENASAVEDDDELSALLARIDTKASVAPSKETPDPVTQEDDASEDMGLDTLAALMAADQAPNDTSGTGENLFDRSEDTDAEAEATEPDVQSATGAEATAAQASRVPAARVARVMRVKRADIDAALASGALEEVDGDDADAASTLSADEEAELQAELAQVQAEFPTAPDAGEDVADMDETAEYAAPQDDEVEDAVAQDDHAPAQEPAIAAEPKAQNLQDEDVSRLMAEAENQMEEPEGLNRRDAFAHLKAAVKAKKADSDIGSDSIKDEGAFRSDLAEVVKPRRPEVSTSRAERAESVRPAPLKLVAEQRVDVKAASKGPVRPRRVAAAPEMSTEAQSTGSFEDYVNELGAHDLPALLEAAASYLSFVEGRDEFSRPQLMTKVRQVETEDFSREDGLRSFGQLLRSGKIEKKSGGRFAVTKEIGYRPEHRAVG